MASGTILEVCAVCEEHIWEDEDYEIIDHQWIHSRCLETHEVFKRIYQEMQMTLEEVKWERRELMMLRNEYRSQLSILDARLSDIDDEIERRNSGEEETTD